MSLHKSVFFFYLLEKVVKTGLAGQIQNYNRFGEEEKNHLVLLSHVKMYLDLSKSAQKFQKSSGGGPKKTK